MDIYYPLFEEVLHGKLSPEREEHVDGLHFTRKLEKMSIGKSRFKGAYQLYFYDATSAKERYYQSILLQELEGYCCDVVEELRQEMSIEVLRYRKKQLLSDHLTTCLMRLGEHLRNRDYRLSNLEPNGITVAAETHSNSYIYQLLKCCLIKAYLEIQYALGRVVSSPLDEKVIRATLVGEVPPIEKLYIQRNKQLPEKEMKTSAKETTPLNELKVPVVSSFYTTAEVCTLLRKSESTINRWVQAGKLDAVKVGKAYRFPKDKMDNFIAGLKGVNKK